MDEWNFRVKIWAFRLLLKIYWTQKHYASYFTVDPPASPAWGLWVYCWSCGAWAQAAHYCPVAPTWHRANSWKASGTGEGSSWLRRCHRGSWWWGGNWIGQNGCKKGWDRKGKLERSAASGVMFSGWITSNKLNSEFKRGKTSIKNISVTFSKLYPFWQLAIHPTHHKAVCLWKDSVSPPVFTSSVAGNLRCPGGLSLAWTGTASGPVVSMTTASSSVSLWRTDTGGEKVGSDQRHTPNTKTLLTQSTSIFNFSFIKEFLTQRYEYRKVYNIHSILSITLNKRYSVLLLTFDRSKIVL